MLLITVCNLYHYDIQSAHWETLILIKKMLGLLEASCVLLFKKKQRLCTLGAMWCSCSLSLVSELQEMWWFLMLYLLITCKMKYVNTVIWYTFKSNEKNAEMTDCWDYLTAVKVNRCTTYLNVLLATSACLSEKNCVTLFMHFKTLIYFMSLFFHTW
jgi:hypothetical protein